MRPGQCNVKDLVPLVNPLRGALNEGGWTFEVVESSEWWCREFWRLRSCWAPVGFEAFLTFLTDPQNDSEVWAVGITALRPTDRSEASQRGYVVSLGRGWRERIPALVSELQRLRTQSATAGK